MMRRMGVAMVSLTLMVGCASAGDGSGRPSGSIPPASVSASGTGGGNGTLYTSVDSPRTTDQFPGWTTTITAHPINVDGSLGPATEVLSGPADDTSYPGVIDGVGGNVVTGSFTNYWTTDVELRSAGQVTAKVSAPRWCGGEGLSGNLCVLLDDARMARTTELGRDPISGAGPTEASILISSLVDGSALAEWGPVPDLTTMLGTESPDEVLLVTYEYRTVDQPAGPSTVLRMDTTDGSTTEVATSPDGWSPLCPVGRDSVLGFTLQDIPSEDVIRTTATSVLLGPGTIADIRWDVEDTVGCSADGRFLYLEDTPEPPTGEADGSEAPNPPTTVERITLADGTSETVAVLEPGVRTLRITR